MKLEIHTIHECPEFGNTIVLMTEDFLIKRSYINNEGILEVANWEYPMCWDYCRKHHGYIGWFYFNEWDTVSQNLVNIIKKFDEINNKK